MLNIPKLQAHTTRSSCCCMKVAAHNKEVSADSHSPHNGSPAPPLQPHTPLLVLWSLSRNISLNRECFLGKISVFDRKRRNAKYEFGMKSTRGGKRTEAWRRKHAHTQKFVWYPNENSSHDIRLLWREKTEREVVLLILLIYLKNK